MMIGVVTFVLLQQMMTETFDNWHVLSLQLLLEAFTDLFCVCGVFKFTRQPDREDFKTEFLHNDFEKLQFDSYLASWYMIGPIGVLWGEKGRSYSQGLITAQAGSCCMLSNNGKPARMLQYRLFHQNQTTFPSWKILKCSLVTHPCIFNNYLESFCRGPGPFLMKTKVGYTLHSSPVYHRANRHRVVSYPWKTGFGAMDEVAFKCNIPVVI